jgi:uroporphyrin-3 C-methyltransferase
MTEPAQADGVESQTAESQTVEGKSQAATRPGGGVSVAAAVVLALAALAASGYALWQLRDLQNLPGQVQADESRNVRQYQDLERRLEQLSISAQANAATLADLQSALSQEVAAMADMSLQLGQLEQRVAGLTGSDASRRNRFLRAEALYYLRIANARVLLARDVRTGVSALQLADDKLRETGDPALVPVRAKLSEELTALRALPEVDIAGISFRLQSLAGQVGEWPAVNPVPDSFKQELPGLDQSGDNAWSRFKNTVQEIFNNIVSVRRSDAPPELQLSAAEQSLVVESVRVELQLARLTLVSGDTALYAQSLQRAAAQIPFYFDSKDSAVTAALVTLEELLSVELPQELPDISASLSLLLGADVNAGADSSAVKASADETQDKSQ